jgi:hypothetical protein
VPTGRIVGIHEYDQIVLLSKACLQQREIDRVVILPGEGKSVHTAANDPFQNMGILTVAGVEHRRP